VISTSHRAHLNDFVFLRVVSFAGNAQSRAIEQATELAPKHEGIRSSDHRLAEKKLGIRFGSSTAVNSNPRERSPQLETTVVYSSILPIGLGS
jgi:hypothetical protein